MRANDGDLSSLREVGTVSPTSRGDRVIIESLPALSPLGLLGLSLLLLGRLPT